MVRVCVWNTAWYSSIMGYYSAVKKNEILPFAAMWMELEGIMLIEISQSEKDKYMFSLMWNLRNSADEHGEGKEK